MWALGLPGAELSMLGRPWVSLGAGVLPAGLPATGPSVGWDHSPHSSFLALGDCWFE